MPAFSPTTPNVSVSGGLGYTSVAVSAAVVGIGAVRVASRDGFYVKFSNTTGDQALDSDAFVPANAAEVFVIPDGVDKLYVRPGGNPVSVTLGVV